MTSRRPDSYSHHEVTGLDKHARLIAAAPEMAEALRHALALIESLDLGEGGGNAAALGMYRAALSKAGLR